MYLLLEPAMITSPCPLLAAEQACDFLPQVFMRVPSNTAWVPLQIDVASFASENGVVDEGPLEVALRAAVTNGDALHDRADWSDPLLEYDSWLNRRLAVAVRGWGDIVHRRSIDPASLATLRDMEQLAEWVVAIMHDQSKRLAASQNWCPAIDEAGAHVLRKDGSKRWGRRWQRAVRDVAVRHRNLTTMSPWDLFPRGKKADLAFADLLPLTRFVDSLAFQCEVDISHWNVNDFKGFYQRLAAIVRCNSGAGLVAKQV